MVSALTASSGFAGSVLITSTAGTPVPLWSTGATAGGVFIGTTGAVPTWSSASPAGGLFITGTSGYPAWLSLGTSGFLITAGTSGAPLWAAAPASGVTILNRVTADTAVANTTAETTIYSFSIAGGTLGTNTRVRLVLDGSFSTRGTATDTFTIRLKYGATTLLSVAPNQSNSAVTAVGCCIEANLTGDGATNAQHGRLRATGGIATAFTDGTNTSLGAVGRGTSAIDSTAAQTLVVTVQWSVASASNSYTMESAILEQL